MSHLFHWRRGIVLLLAVVALVATACAASTGQGQSGATTAVRVALDWYPNTNHTGIYAAMQQGYYRQHGLTIALTTYGATAPEALVATGQAQFAISFEEYLAVNRAQGQPIVAIAAIMQHDTTAMATLASSGITRPADFVGKRFASGGDPAEQGVIYAMETNDGATSLGYQSITVNNADTSSLISHAADFVWIYKGVEGVQAQDKGVKLNMFAPTDYGVPDSYSPVLITSESELQQHPEVVRQFLAATAQGYTYATQHPDQAVDMLLNGAKAQGGAEFDSRQVALDSQNYASKQYVADAKCWGVMTLDHWKGYPQFLYRHGVLTDANNKPLTTEPDYSAMFTSAYLPACP